LIEEAGASIVEVGFNEVLKKTVLYAERLRLRVLDLIVSSILRCGLLVTLDMDIINKSEKIGRS
jgi:hypothetical protein